MEMVEEVDKKRRLQPQRFFDREAEFLQCVLAGGQMESSVGRIYF